MILTHIAAFWIGIFIGILLMCLMAIAREDDEWHERNQKKGERK